MDYKDKIINDLVVKIANLELANTQLAVEIQSLREQIQAGEAKEGD